MAEANTHPSKLRNEDGLLLEQARVIQLISAGENPRQACLHADIAWKRFKGWINRDEAFKDAYRGIIGNTVDLAKEAMEESALRATQVYQEAMDANRIIEQDVRCPECSHEFTAEIQVPHWAVRLASGKVVLQATKVLKDVRELQGTVISLTFEESLALAAIQSQRDGRLAPEVPPNMLERLRQRGLLEGGTVEGQFVEVDPEISQEDPTNVDHRNGEG